MITAWLEGFERIDLDLTGVEAPEVGRPYDETSHPKVCLHRTEGGGLAGAERAFAAYPPHLGVDIVKGLKHQYLPLDRCSFALKGTENDDEFVVQVEIVGFSTNTPDMTDEALDWLGEEVVAPIWCALGAPVAALVAPPQGFKAPSDVPYRLATPDSPLRFSLAGFRAFSGVMGHQHAPAPDAHWDPGGLRIARVLAAARRALTQEDEMSAEEVAALNKRLDTLSTRQRETDETVKALAGSVAKGLAHLEGHINALLAPYGSETTNQLGEVFPRGDERGKPTSPVYRMLTDLVTGRRPGVEDEPADDPASPTA